MIRPGSWWSHAGTATPFAIQLTPDRETYAPGAIRCVLTDSAGIAVPLDTLPETAELVPELAFGGGIMLASKRTESR